MRMINSDVYSQLFFTMLLMMHEYSDKKLVISIFAQSLSSHTISDLMCLWYKETDKNEKDRIFKQLEDLVVVYDN